MDSSHRSVLMLQAFSCLHTPLHVETQIEPHCLSTLDTPEQTMNADQILTEIREANLSYLMLAQSLIRTDREQEIGRAHV